MLASLDEARLQDVMQRIRFVPLTRNTPKTVEELTELIETGRSRGYYVNAEHSIEGLTTLSAAFTWQQTTYIVTIAAPSARISARLDEVGSLLLDACHRLEMRKAHV